MLKKLLGITPTLEADGSYSPSKLSLKLATSQTTDYKKVAYQPYQGRKSKVLVLFTEQQHMKMQNGKRFSTGNHPVEALVPMLHLKDAGFDFEIVTPTGKPVVIEMWAFPRKDEHVSALFDTLKTSFAQPKSLAELINSAALDANEYAAVLVPGGHGAMLGLPEDDNVQQVLRWAHENDLYTMSICHGPAALFALTKNNQPFIYKGYNMAVFPDAMDNFTPKIGYLPGKMPSGLSEKLSALGVNLTNTKADATVCIDRKLITGASPQAANAFGKLAAETLLAELS